MTPAERFERAMEIVQAAFDKPAEERHALVAHECGSDTELRREVESLLVHDDGAHEALIAAESPAGAAALWQDLTDTGPTTPPERIGNYRIVREIGRGGMGVVYEARQDSPDRTVALKVLTPGLFHDQLLKRFLREAELLGRLRHPGIAHVYEASVADVETNQGATVQRAFFAMELVEGVPLDVFARRDGLDTRSRLLLCAKICDAVEHAHERGIVHRDLKPANILVEPGGHPKVLDFGVSRSTDADVHAVTLQTHAGQLIGTIPYMSPEQVQGDPSAIDARSDVYSLGVVLFELLSDRLPYEIRNRPIPEAIRTIQEQDPSRLSSISRAYRGDIETIVGKALEKEPERRYQSAADMAADIRRHLAEEPLVARPASTMYQMRKFARRNKALVCGVVATMAACVAGAGFATHYAIRADRNARLAGAREAASLRASYHASVFAGAAAIRENDVATAELRLMAAPESLRNWEWEHLVSRLDQCLASASFPFGSLERRAKVFSRGDVKLWFGGAGRRIFMARRGRGLLQAPVTVKSWDADSFEPSATWGIPEARLFAPDVSGDALFVETKTGSAAMLSSIDGSVIRTVDTICRKQLERSAFIHQRIPESSIDAQSSPFSYKLRDGVRPYQVVFGADGQSIAAWNRGNISVFDRSDPDHVVEIEFHHEGVSSAVFTPDGRYLATAGNNRRLALFDLQDRGRRVWERHEAHRDAILALSVSPDGSTLATGGQDRILRLWDLNSWRPLGSMNGHRHPILGLSFNNDGTRLVSASADRIRVWSLEAAQDLTVMSGHEWQVSALAVSPDGAMLGSIGRTVRLWDVRTGFPVTVLPCRIQPYRRSMSFSLDGRRLLCQSVVIDSRTGRELMTLEGTGGLADHRFEASGRFIVGRTRLLDADSYALVHDDVDLQQWNLDRAGQLVSISNGKTDSVAVLNLATSDVIRQWSYSALSPTAIIQDGRILAVTTRDCGIVLLDVESGRELAKLTGHTDTVSCLIEIPQRDILVSGSDDRTIRLWRLDTMQEIAVLRGHSDKIHALAVTPDGRTLFSASGDYTIRRWDTRPARELLEARVAYRQVSARLAPRIDALFTEFHDPGAVADHFESDDSLTPRERQIALQLVLRKSVSSLDY